MLSFAEEIYLLALDDTTGKITLYSKDLVLNSVLTGAVISELCFLGRLDNDQEKFYLLNSEPTGQPILDHTLELFAQSGVKEDTIEHWLRVLVPQAESIEQEVLNLLLDKKILKKVEERVLWFFPSRRYPVVDNQEVADVETRLRHLVNGNDIPDPRETVLVGLVYASGLFHEILSPREYNRCKTRIEQLAKLDMVGQKIVELIQQVNEIASLPPFV